MDVLKDLIDRKRREGSEISSKFSKKYIKRGEVESIHAVQDPVVEVIVPQTEIKFTTKDLDRKLRSRKQPIRLFGEDENARSQRLIKLLGDERKQMAMYGKMMKQTEESINEDLLKDEEMKKNERYEINIKQSLISTSGISRDLLRTDETLNCKLIVIYLRRLLSDWGRSLELRSDDEKRTPQGKILSANQQQSSEHLKPLFRSLRKKLLLEDVVEKITEICFYVQLREYMKANDAYIRLSIGNAAWPLGITGVGVHERKNLDRIAQSQIAHVLNDETQRKWIQSIKRLMTFSQQMYPPEDCSKLVG